MSFFNLRRGGQSSKSTPGLGAPAESLEIVRKRAKHRLIGSAVLVLLGVIGFPLLFDTQPRPVSVNIPIEIPSKQGAKPLSMPAEVLPAAASVAAVEPEPMPAPAPAAVNSPAAKESEVAAVAAPVTASPAPAPKPVSAPVVAQVASTPAKASNDKPADKATAATPKTDELRLVVQVGAFADVAKARDARLKLEKAGLKTYTQVAETKDGKRIRVRVGPYASKADADKAAKQIKALDLPAAILTL